MRSTKTIPFLLFFDVSICLMFFNFSCSFHVFRFSLPSIYCKNEKKRERAVTSRLVAQRFPACSTGYCLKESTKRGRSSSSTFRAWSLCKHSCVTQHTTVRPLFLARSWDNIQLGISARVPLAEGLAKVDGVVPVSLLEDGQYRLLACD